MAEIDINPMKLVTAQIAIKMAVKTSNPPGYSDLEWLKKTVMQIYSKLIECDLLTADEVLWIENLVRATGFREKIINAKSSEEVIKACVELWRASNGVLDLCP